MLRATFILDIKRLISIGDSMDDLNWFRVQFSVIEKLTSAYYLKTLRETMLLLVNNIN